MTAVISQEEEDLLRQTCEEVGVAYIPPPTHMRTITTTENQKRLDGMYKKVAHERSKKLCKARIIDKLNRSSHGRELLLGRSIFKQLILKQKQGVKDSSSSFITSNNKIKQDEVNGNDKRSSQAIIKRSSSEHEALQKYLEHRALRHLCRKKLKERVNFNAHQKLSNKVSDLAVYQDFPLRQPKKNGIVPSTA
eukprot:CAMPEP_0194160062 /NCGR_PEP_ID=MMETSP0152-20130528/78183_1 /TAXON_ID=1049557 /ORGANISM="Thalassiothrix antarctica, Strain L6-D1" /LENGTH=192 /DNA_ID=CAMNT_0038869709 /DNA_START=114 /DNA_END=692 /DNA_ORIENTATION=+